MILGTSQNFSPKGRMTGIWMLVTCMKFTSASIVCPGISTLFNGGQMSNWLWFCVYVLLTGHAWFSCVCIQGDCFSFFTSCVCIYIYMYICICMYSPWVHIDIFLYISSQAHLDTLPKINSSPLKIGHPKQETSLPTTIFQGWAVSFR